MKTTCPSPARLRRLARWTWLAGWLLGLLAWSGCKPEVCEDWTNPACPNYCVDETDPECPNYDPCTAEMPVSAAFRIIENGSFTTQLPVFDTVYYDTIRSTQLIKQAIHVHPDWRYTWYIGSATYEGPECSLSYSSAPNGIPIGITLVVEGPPNTACFPDDDGRDTMTRRVVFSKKSFFALFHGYLNGDPADTITLGFLPNPDMPLLPILYNFKRGCFKVGGWDFASTTRSFLFMPGSTNKCDRPTGLMVRDPEKTGDFERVRCEYTLTPPGGAPIIFEGREVRR